MKEKLKPQQSVFDKKTQSKAKKKKTPDKKDKKMNTKRNSAAKVINFWPNPTERRRSKYIRPSFATTQIHNVC